MLTQAFRSFVYSGVILSLFLIDFILGNGFVDMIQKLIYRIIYFIRSSIPEEAKTMFVSENPINVTVFIVEFLVLGLTIMLLDKYKQSRVHRLDRMDFLLQESKDALRKTNDVLEKWRLRRQVPTEYSYLYEELQEMKPLNIEVPIMHMAIIDTLGTTRSKQERGDAGDTYNITDSTLLSVTSLIDDDLDSTPELVDDERVDDTRSIEFRNNE